MAHAEYRRLPAVNVLLADDAVAALEAQAGHDAVVLAARNVLDDARRAIAKGASAPEQAALVAQIRARLHRRPQLYRRVLNATGVVLHTNLGRSPIPDVAWDAMTAARDYCDLEMDLSTGKRASRLRGVSKPLCAVTGAEAGFVVNNNAAALMLGLAGLAGKQPTAVSRGHLVEIGGGFRLPTIMEASGSPLMEIGTTNRTHLKDYEKAIDAGARLVLVVHQSNFSMTGYVTEPEPAEIVSLCREHQVPVLFDLGSGALADGTDRGLPPETTVQQAVKQGFDVVCFSGDKLLGGPQAGYLVGRQSSIDRLRTHPLARALRCDKIQLAGCVATLELYRRGEAEKQIPIWQMLSRDTRDRAHRWQMELGVGDVVEADGAVGGGSLPGAEIAGFALALDLGDTGADALLSRLRAQDPPVVGHIVNDRILLHPRTVHPRDDDALIESVRKAIRET